MTKISIIIPVFQVEDYIAQCIDSILKQTFQDFELLLIDDGSKDDSGKICDEYAVMNEKVRVIHQINAGVTAARRKGVEMSGGEWLCFVDSDDTLPEDSLEVLVHASQGVDIVIGNFQIVNEDGCIEVCRKTVFQGDSMKWDHIAYLRAMLESRTPASVWGRLVKRELFDEQIFNIPREIVLGEDYILCIRLAVKNIKVKNINDIVYNYIRRSDSATGIFKHTWEYKKKIDSFVLGSIRENCLEEYCQDSIMQHHFRWLRCCILDKELKYDDPLICSIRRNTIIRLQFKDRIYLRLLILPIWGRKVILKILHELNMLFQGTKRN